MLHRTRSFSSSSCISMENSASHRRSASDPVIKPGVGDNFSQEGDLESCTNGDDSNNHFDNEVRPAAESSSKTEPQVMDPKRIKRLLANRVSAQRSRLRNLEYMEKLQREINKEEARLSMLSPQVSLYEIKCKVLEIKNCEMKEKLEAMEIEKAAKEAEFQALLEERKALYLIYKLLQE